MEEWHILHVYAEYCIMLGMILSLHEYARKDTVLMLSVRWKGYVEVKNKYKYLLASLKLLLIFKDCSKGRIIISVPASLSVIGRFSLVSTPHWMQEKSS
jgi:hypothetical protein